MFFYDQRPSWLEKARLETRGASQEVVGRGPKTATVAPSVANALRENKIRTAIISARPQFEPEGALQTIEA